MYKDEDADVQTAALSALKSISESFPEIIQDACLEELFSELKSFPHLLKHIAHLSTHPNLFTFTLPKLLVDTTQEKLKALADIVHGVSKDAFSDVGPRIIMTLLENPDAAVPGIITTVMRAISSQAQQSILNALDISNLDMNIVVILGNLRRDIVPSFLGGGELATMMKEGTEAEVMAAASLLNKLGTDQIVESALKRVLEKVERFETSKRIMILGWVSSFKSL